MWRPEGWEALRWEACGADIAQAYEDGADAMLEALKATGTYLNGDLIIPATNINPEIHCPGDTKGWLILIEEEK